MRRFDGGVVLVAALASFVLLACGSTGELPEPGDSSCERCLAEGGAWYPSGELCESSCVIADAACFTEQCPPPCDATCEGCFSQAACEQAACAWNVQDEWQRCVLPVEDPCEACLAGGGTWQPEAEECTTNCDIMDISCYTDACPGPCGERCGYCFTEEECRAVGCQWAVDAEAMWCSGTPAP